VRRDCDVARVGDDGEKSDCGRDAVSPDDDVADSSDGDAIRAHGNGDACEDSPSRRVICGDAYECHRPRGAMPNNGAVPPACGPCDAFCDAD
jgi:hypothetical protein